MTGWQERKKERGGGAETGGKSKVLFFLSVSWGPHRAFTRTRAPARIYYGELAPTRTFSSFFFLAPLPSRLGAIFLSDNGRASKRALYLWPRALAPISKRISSIVLIPRRYKLLDSFFPPLLSFAPLSLGCESLSLYRAAHARFDTMKIFKGMTNWGTSEYIIRLWIYRARARHRGGIKNYWYLLSRVLLACEKSTRSLFIGRSRITSLWLSLFVFFYTIAIPPSRFFSIIRSFFSRCSGIGNDLPRPADTLCL